MLSFVPITYNHGQRGKFGSTNRLTVTMINYKFTYLKLVKFQSMYLNIYISFRVYVFKILLRGCTDFDKKMSVCLSGSLNGLEFWIHNWTGQAQPGEVL